MSCCATVDLAGLDEELQIILAEVHRAVDLVEAILLPLLFLISYLCQQRGIAVIFKDLSHSPLILIMLLLLPHSNAALSIEIDQCI